jgi:hypothetical protein
MDNVVEEADLLISCGGLVTIEQSDRKVTVHRSLYEHFTGESGSRHLEVAKHLMATICLRYLLLEPFSTGHCIDRQQWDQRHLDYPFLRYAACNWGFHVTGTGEDDLASQICSLFNSNGNLYTAAQSYLWQFGMPKEPGVPRRSYFSNCVKEQSAEEPFDRQTLRQ